MTPYQRVVALHALISAGALLASLLGADAFAPRPPSPLSVGSCAVYNGDRKITAINRRDRKTSLLLSKLREVDEEASVAPRRKAPPVVEIDENSIDVERISQLSKCKTGSNARNILEGALKSPNGSGKASGRLYASLSIPPGISDKPVSDAELALQTKIRSKYKVMDLIELTGDRDADRAALSLLCLFIASSASAIVANQNLPGPEVVRFLVVWALSFAPLAFVGYGIATPAKLQTFLVSIQRSIFPTYRKRMVQHEAGHFLLGHLLGLPIKGYRANAVRNAVEFYPLSDPGVGRNRAAMLGFDVRAEDLEEEYDDDVWSPTSSGDVPFFGEGGRGEDELLSRSVFRNGKNITDNPFLKLPSRDEPTTAWPYRGFDHRTLDKLAVVSVAGVCAEILAFGNAEGGYADLSQLRQLFNSAEPGLSDNEMENRVRFAVGFGMMQLRQNLGALDSLADVMERDGTVAECVLAIETCPDVGGGSGDVIQGNYELRRRDKFRREGVGWLERALLSSGKNADTEDDDVIYGKGGGERKRRFELSGDDPFYAALGLATVFFVWASTGGLSLH